MNEYCYNDIVIGHTEEFETIINSKIVDDFMNITKDINPLHINEEYAKSKGHDGKVVYGMLTASYLSTLAGVYLPGKYSLIHSVEVKFTKPLLVDVENKIRIVGEVTKKDDLFKLLTIKVTIFNESNDKVCRAIMKVGVLDEQ